VVCKAIAGTVGRGVAPSTAALSGHPGDRRPTSADGMFCADPDTEPACRHARGRVIGNSFPRVKTAVAAPACNPKPWRWYEAFAGIRLDRNEPLKEVPDDQEG
jgi:hypothetical protein